MTLAKEPTKTVVAPLEPLQRLRSYSRRTPDGQRETWDQTCDRTLYSPHLGLKVLGKFTDEEMALIDEMQRKKIAFGSARWLWVGGTEWIEKPENYSGAFNCTSTRITDWNSFGYLMDLAMQGSGTGAVVELDCIDKLPAIANELRVEIKGKPGDVPAEKRAQKTVCFDNGSHYLIAVGDSRQGWVKAYQELLELASDSDFPEPDHALRVVIDLSSVRPSGAKLKGFGGVANPVRLPETLVNCANILNGAIGRKLNSVEVCLLIGEGAAAVVAGNVRRCLPENTLVHTKNGLVPIKNVQVGELVQTPLGFRKILDKFDQSIQNVVVVKTNGTFMRATENHRVAVMTDAIGGYGWKQVGDLQPGDRLLQSTEVLPGVVTQLPADCTANRPKNSSTCKGITIPNLDADVAWLIGFLHGDGCVHRYTNKHGKPFGEVSFSGNAGDEEVTPVIKQKLEVAIAKFGLTIKHNIKDGGSTYHGRVGSIRLAEYLLQIKQPNQPIQIPGFILQGTPEIRAAYLAGLVDSDGAVSNRPVQLICTVYSEFRDQVAILYSSLGIPTRVGYTNKAAKESHRDRHTLSLVGFREAYNRHIAPYSAKGLLKIVVPHHTFTVPGRLMMEAYTCAQMRIMGFQGSRSVDSSHERYMTESGLALDVPITVEGIERIEVAQTWDIEVEDAHCFYADGFLTHNSAGIRQGSADDDNFTTSKDNLWTQENGNWRIDPKRDALRTANHTRVFHRKPTLEECTESVRKQFYSGEGAIQYAPEAIARSNADLLDVSEKKKTFLDLYNHSRESAEIELTSLMPGLRTRAEIDHRMQRYSQNPCAEIIGGDAFHCNLGSVHLNQIDPFDFKAQEKAFKASALQASAYLQRGFVNRRYQFSREVDPIVAVSFTGAFTFFVNAFGVNWLKWWQAGRPQQWGYFLDAYTIPPHPFSLPFKKCLSDFYLDVEQIYFQNWRDIVHQTVWDYCDRHNLKRPNRCTTLKPEGSLTLLTGVGACGWHPPKAKHYIRRMTFGAHDPIALAAIDYGYTVVPSQSCKDDDGNLLNDPFDPRVTEWLVEVPVEEPWANLSGAEDIDPSAFPVEAQFDFYMQVQKYYTTHNTSATIEIYEHEIEKLAGLIHNAIAKDEGYISAAIMGRSDGNSIFPRLPFEPISRERYQELTRQVSDRRQSDDFMALISRHETEIEAGPADSACDSGACLLK